MNEETEHTHVRVNLSPITGEEQEIAREIVTLLGYQVVGLNSYQTVELLQIPDDNPPTVKGNSRQKLVEGKRHTWPATKPRKGHR